jgi:peroxiredoxin
MVHVRDIIEEFVKRDAKVLGISAQDGEELRKYLTFHSMPFTVVNDVNKDVIKAYGLEHDVGPPRGVTARPTGIILDGEGRMRFIYIGAENDDLPLDKDLFEVLDGI